nr:molecular chaperone [Providencia rustigianii]
MNNINLLKIKKPVLYRLVSGVALLTALFTQPAWANNLQDQINGLTLHSTRVIYPHDAKNGVTYTLTNNTAIPYLLQARLLPWEGSSSSKTTGDTADANLTAFIALPPLQRFEPGETLTLRILQKHNLLTQDKESIAQLSLTAIPAQSKDAAEGAQMILAVQNNLKLFYRPAGLPEHNLDNIAEQLQFQRTKNTLTLKNPTPFYVTLASLSVGEKRPEFKSLTHGSPLWWGAMAPWCQPCRKRHSLAVNGRRWRNQPNENTPTLSNVTALYR